ncbi:hypothetical protein B0H11DRAFT_1908353 [Mycena galericulata]|nr:hypothetical protein B0H11DRAFT_1908353 [Mycena galericulata]
MIQKYAGDKTLQRPQNGHLDRNLPVFANGHCGLSSAKTGNPAIPRVRLDDRLRPKVPAGKPWARRGRFPASGSPGNDRFFGLGMTDFSDDIAMPRGRRKQIRYGRRYGISTFGHPISCLSLATRTPEFRAADSSKEYREPRFESNKHRREMHPEVQKYPSLRRRRCAWDREAAVDSSDSQGLQQKQKSPGHGVLDAQ